MTTVYKYEIRMGANAIEMPAGSIPVKFAKQDGKIFVWCLVDTTRGSALHGFNVVGTGHPIPAMFSELDHVGTLFEGPLVWHCFSIGDLK